MWIYPKVFITIFNWKVSVCGESRTHGLEGAVERRLSTATLPINPEVSGNCYCYTIRIEATRFHPGTRLSYRYGCGNRWYYGCETLFCPSRRSDHFSRALFNERDSLVWRVHRWASRCYYCDRSLFKSIPTDNRHRRSDGYPRIRHR